MFAHCVVYRGATYREFLGYLLIANSVHLGTPEDSPVTLAVDVLINDAIDLAVCGRIASLLVQLVFAMLHNFQHKRFEGRQTGASCRKQC